MDPAKPLDRTDRRILRLLQEFGRLSNVELAKAVNLSPTPCQGNRIWNLLAEMGCDDG